MGPFRRSTSKKLGEILIDLDIIDSDGLERGLNEQSKNGGLLGSCLVRLNLITEEDLAQAFSLQYGIPYLPLSQYQLDPQIIDFLPMDYCAANSIIAIDKIGKTLTVSTANPLNLDVLDEAKKITGLFIQTFVSTEEEIVENLENHKAKDKK